MPGTKFYKVPVEEIKFYWPSAKGLVQEALDAVECYQTTDTVLTSLLAGTQELWMMEDVGLIITQVFQAPTAKICFLMYCAGNNISAMLEDTEDSIVAWARTLGCTRVCLAGRFGWFRKLKFKGYRPTGVILEREI